jgi:hypothetical protein
MEQVEREVEETGRARAQLAEVNASRSAAAELWQAEYTGLDCCGLVRSLRLSMKQHNTCVCSELKTTFDKEKQAHEQSRLALIAQHDQADQFAAANLTR